MFWIYGGSLRFGHAGQLLYDGSAFAAYQDVIVVTANYRTNVFGFPLSPELPLSKRNLGFLDQRLALQWVRTNIGAFGGSAAKVTIFGESAGATSVDALLTSYSTQTAPFRAAILESGQHSYSAQSYSNSPAQWPSFLREVGCTSGATEIACLRKLPAVRIKDAINTLNSNFQPTVDGVTLVHSSSAARAAGHFARVPVLVGTNSQEGRVYTVGTTNETAFLQSYLGQTPAQIPKVRAAYSKGFDSTYDRISQIFTDFGFLCPEFLFANESVAARVPTWLYQYNASFPNSAFADSAGDSGAYHSSEIGMVFQSYAGGPINPVSSTPRGLLQSQKPATSKQKALSRFVNTAWAKFAKNPTAGPGWPALQLGAAGQMGILGNGSVGGVGVAVVKQSHLHAICPLFKPLYDLFAYT